MTTRATRERRLVGGLSLALVTLAIVIGTIVWQDRQTVTEVPFVAPPPERLSRLEIERPGRETLVLERRDAGAETETDGGRWRIVEPCAIDANDARVAPLLDALAGARLDYRADDVDLAAAGLVEPLAVVRLDGTSVALGEIDVTGERRYARVGERVAFVPEWVLSLVEGGLSALAEPAPFATAEVRRMQRLPTSRSGASEAQAPDGEARDSTASDATAPDGAASADAVATLDPGPWSDLAASQVVDWPLPDAPTTTRETRLEATLGSGETRVLALVGNADWNALIDGDDGCARLFPDADLPANVYH